MKKSNCLSTLLIFLFFMVFISQIEVAKSDPKTIVVPDDFLTIQETMDAALDGDSVFVKMVSIVNL